MYRTSCRIRLCFFFLSFKINFFWFHPNRQYAQSAIDSFCILLSRNIVTNTNTLEYFTKNQSTSQKCILVNQWNYYEKLRTDRFNHFDSSRIRTKFTHNKIYPQIYNNTPTHTSPANLKYRTFAFNNFSLIVVDIWQQLRINKEISSKRFSVETTGNVIIDFSLIAYIFNDRTVKRVSREKHAGGLLLYVSRGVLARITPPSTDQWNPRKKRRYFGTASSGLLSLTVSGKRSSRGCFLARGSKSLYLGRVYQLESINYIKQQDLVARAFYLAHECFVGYECFSVNTESSNAKLRSHWSNNEESFVHAPWFLKSC